MVQPPDGKPAAFHDGQSALGFQTYFLYYLWHCLFSIKMHKVFLVSENSSLECFANLYVLHEAVALATAGQGLPSGSNG